MIQVGARPDPLKREKPRTLEGPEPPTLDQPPNPLLLCLAEGVALFNNVIIVLGRICLESRAR